MRFTKMQGAGNDFIILEDLNASIRESEYASLARKLCHRRLSIGADGMIVVLPADDADFKIAFYNADGSPAEMCGNGARCIARYGYEHGLSGEVQTIETTAGIVVGQRIDRTRYRIRLNDPCHIQQDMIVEASGEKYSCTYMELGAPGIPHCLVRLDDWDILPQKELLHIGKSLRFSPLFPKGANVTFRMPLKDDRWKCITFERGVEDFTLACGTGAGSTACAMLLEKEIDHFPVSLVFPGGTLEIELKHDGDRIFDLLLTGPTQVVAEGEYIGI